MKINYLITTIIFIVFTGHISSQAQQASSSDKYTLLTEPFNLRPINVHKGQLQFNAGYQMSIRTKYYDSDGELAGLAEDASASIQHSYLLSMKYGVLEFFELGAEMNYHKKGVREATENFLSGINLVTINTLKEYNGFEDLFLYGSLSLPFDADLVDFALKGGVSINSAKHKPDKPDHTYDYFGLGSYTFNYHYKNHNGTGTPVWKAGADLQVSINKITLYTNVLFSSPLREVESFYWSEFFENGKFIYTSNNYKFLPQESFNIYASLHYQALNWLDLSLAYNKLKSTGGWISYNDVKYSVPNLGLDNLEMGLEIQVSPLIRLSEVAGFTIGGQNADGPFYIMTSLSFNMIPF